MQLRSIFRALVLGEWIILLVGLPGVWARFFIGVGTHETVTVPSEAWYFPIVVTAISMAAIAASIGLWQFRRWGRILYVATQVISLAAGLMAPTLLHWRATNSVRPFPTTPIDWLSGPITGAIIALAYASPIGAEFERFQDARGIASNPAAGVTSG